MREEANAAGFYTHPLMHTQYPRVKIVTIEEIIEDGKRLDVPMGLDVVKAAKAADIDAGQGALDMNETDA